ncbi:Clp1-domain-containing protein [Xylariomycetidae sp. FL2044]|nr:Clp1-domain-containing protein [Xylariomycetidae sp. FL2044]
MSIPGLGQIAPTAVPINASSSATTSPTTTHTLQPFWEYRFEVPQGSELTVKLLSGTAEKDGTELAPNHPYAFSGTKSKINTWLGCTLEVSSPTGSYDAYISELGEDTPMVSYLNLHMKLEGLRATAKKATPGQVQMGPRVLVVGPSNVGKTSLVKMLAGWATRMGSQPLVINTDCREGMLTFAGTMSAAVFATIMDITTEWGSTPSSGPSAIPVKLPLAYYFGLAQPESNPEHYQALLSKLAVACTSRLTEDPDVKTTGFLIDTAGMNAASKSAYEHIAHIVSEFSVNIIIVLGSERVSSEMQRRFGGQTTSLGETVAILSLDKSGGIVERDAGFMQHIGEAAIREYFFGNAKNTLSPFTQQIDFSGVSMFKILETSTTSTKPEEDDMYASTSSPPSGTIDKVEPSLMMQNCVLAVMYASVRDAPEAIGRANVMGFVYVADVDEKRRKLKVLAPVGARLGDRPLLWGAWPEPMVSLLG